MLNMAAKNLTSDAPLASCPVETKRITGDALLHGHQAQYTAAKRLTGDAPLASCSVEAKRVTGDALTAIRLIVCSGETPHRRRPIGQLLS